MSLKNNIFSGLGSIIEWFDFALYGFFGPIFSVVFFPSALQKTWLSLIITYLVFAIGFAARPIGALVFGFLGDKYGRLFSLRLTPIFITFFTASIAFLPSYQFVGNAAIFLLIVIRILQGILLGGEFAGNIVYLCESSWKWKYFWGSIGSFTGSLGIVIASVTASIFYTKFSSPFLYEYGWRIAFLFSVPFGLIAFFTRLKMRESPCFQKSTSCKNPITTSIRYHKKTIYACIGLIYLHATSFYFVFMFIPVYLTKVRQLTESDALLHNTGFLIAHLFLIPLFGIIVNLYDGLKSQVIVGITFTFLSMPIFYFIAYGTKNQILVSLFIFSAMTAINAAIIPGLLSKIIPNEVRYTILALSFNIGFGIFGGITPFLSLFLIKLCQNIMIPSAYLSFAALMTTCTTFQILKDKRVHEVREIQDTE